MSAVDPRALGAVAVGGALGAVARWGLGELVPDGAGFPWTTFAINVTGSFLLAVVLGLAAVRRRPVLRAGLGPGVLGGYTTLSAVSEQSRALLADGRAATALVYLVATAVVAVAAVAVGARVGAGR
ncbi:fluoride efflux transporter FluC [Nocardioides lianchengensis]|uniref:Fluoride-specific ion channel FluC n=1 Tax=Nocardioides lianchengensis TaxID=1045774 RepID=A0A1G6XVB7_9ACTN|nr:CrcB family protein [Nocardioides lianchengensis]NYG13428.1 CrcB protein [Nocardioides lianchengensis]SDD81367.1 CrcB protein [Nocardioides lianchengensis]